MVITKRSISVLLCFVLGIGGLNAMQDGSEDFALIWNDNQKQNQSDIEMTPHCPFEFLLEPTINGNILIISVEIENEDDRQMWLDMRHLVEVGKFDHTIRVLPDCDKHKNNAIRTMSSNFYKHLCQLMAELIIASQGLSLKSSGVYFLNPHQSGFCRMGVLILEFNQDLKEEIVEKNFNGIVKKDCSKKDEWGEVNNNCSIL